MQILLVGGGDLAQQIAHYLTAYDTQVQVVGFVDDSIENGEKRFGLECLGSIKDIIKLYERKRMDAVMICIGYSHLTFRQQLFEKLSVTIPVYTFIHPSAFIDSSAIVGRGCCIGPNVVIEQRSIIEPNVFLYGGVNISHDCRVGAHSFIAPSTAIAGYVSIGMRCFLGLHSSIIEKLIIADDIVIGAGALVTHDIIESGTYIGVPARKR